MKRTHASHANKSKWGTHIESLSINHATDFMRSVLEMCVTENGVPPELETHFSYAFSTFITKILKLKQYLYLDQLHLPEQRLIYLTEICHNNCDNDHVRLCGINIMLEVAGQTKRYVWAHSVYSLALNTKTCDAVTFSSAMKAFGKEKDFAAVNDAFNQFYTLKNIPKDQLAKGYGIMLQACHTNQQYQRAFHIFSLAKEENSVNGVILSTMIKIAGASGQYAAARRYLNEIHNIPGIQPDIIKRAEKDFRLYTSISFVPTPSRKNISGRLESPPHQPNISTQNSVFLPRFPRIQNIYGVIGENRPPRTRIRTSPLPKPVSEPVSLLFMQNPSKKIIPTKTPMRYVDCFKPSQ